MPRRIRFFAFLLILALAGAAGGVFVAQELLDRRTQRTPRPSATETPLAAPPRARPLEISLPDVQAPDAARMAWSIVRGRPFADDEGWFDGSQCRYRWAWLEERFDKNFDGRIAPREMAGREDWFARLDLNRDGVLVDDDLDWSSTNDLAARLRKASRWLSPLDASGDGKLTREEWRRAFRELAGEKSYLSPDDVSEFVERPPRVGVGSARASSAAWSAATKLAALVRGDLGSLWPGPRLDEEAPEIDLPVREGEPAWKLSQFRGVKPVVVVLGSPAALRLRTELGSLNQLIDRYADRVQFVAVCVAAAPLADLVALESASATFTPLAPSPDWSARLAAADEFRKVVDSRAMLAMDQVDDSVCQAYGGSPGRLYVVDRDGWIAFKGGREPFGATLREVEQAIVMTLLAEETNDDRPQATPGL